MFEKKVGGLEMFEYMHKQMLYSTLISAIANDNIECVKKIVSLLKVNKRIRNLNEVRSVLTDVALVEHSEMNGPISVKLLNYLSKHTLLTSGVASYVIYKCRLEYSNEYSTEYAQSIIPVIRLVYVRKDMWLNTEIEGYIRYSIQTIFGSIEQFEEQAHISNASTTRSRKKIKL